jgi:hypothetical protein
MRHTELSPQQTPDHKSWLGPVSSLVAILLSAPTPGIAANLKPETLRRWKEYITAADARNQKHLSPGSKFLSIDAIPGQIPRL